MPRSEFSLLADENIPIEVVKILSGKGIDIKRIKLGSKDKQIFELAKSEKRTLLTLDKHFLNRAKFPPIDSWGIIFLKVHPPMIDTISFSLDRLFKALKPRELKGKLLIISSSGSKIWSKK